MIHSLIISSLFPVYHAAGLTLLVNYRDRLKGMQILLSRTQAGAGRTGKQEQEQNSRNHVQAFLPISVLLDYAPGDCDGVDFGTRHPYWLLKYCSFAGRLDSSISASADFSFNPILFRPKSRNERPRLHNIAKKEVARLMELLRPKKTNLN